MKSKRLWVYFCSLTVVLSSFFSLSSASGAANRNIVNPKQVYTYEVMVRDMKTLASTYPELISYRSIGKSEYGRDLWDIQVGRGATNVILNGSHHAREWITTITLMEMADQLGQSAGTGATWNGLRVSDMLDHVTFHIIPMVNPDGVTIQQKGLSAVPQQDRAALIRINGGSSNFSRWKANAKGIDLNRQYPADWQSLRNSPAVPAFKNYKGKAPLQAKEARTMVDFTRILKPEFVIAYHSSGEILYWEYKTPAAHLQRDLAFAKAYSAMTGYDMIPVEPNPSGGGYTDWFIAEFGKPAMTPELGRYAGETNVPLSAWDRVWSQQNNIVWLLGKTAISLNMQRQSAVGSSGDVELSGAAMSYASPDLASKSRKTLRAGIYSKTRSKGSWVEIRNGHELRWVAASLLRPAVLPQHPEPDPTPQPTEPTPTQTPVPPVMAEPTAAPSASTEPAAPQPTSVPQASVESPTPVNG